METIAVTNDSEAEKLKELGNDAYNRKDYALALQFFNQALTLDPNNHKYLTNRSLCYATLGQWVNSAKDARTAISHSAKYEKAHYRLGKALIELSRFKEARIAVINALKDCGETKDLKALEEAIFVSTGIALRPQSTDFDIVDELGDGNFSKVYKACHKKTKKLYAIKVLDLQSFVFLFV